MIIFILVVIFVFLSAFLSVKWKYELSAFEVSRRAKKDKKYARIEKFREIYPGFLVFSRIISLLLAALFSGLLFADFGFLESWVLAFVFLIISWIISRLLEDFSSKLISKNIDFLLKYFAWTGIFSRISRLEGEIKISSKNELLHVISQAEFLSESDKLFFAKATDFREKKVSDVIVPRNKIAFVHAKDELTPLFIDELFESGHKIFPVVNKDLDHVVGLLDLDDFREISGKQEILSEKMRKISHPISADESLADALRFFAKNNVVLALVSRNEKIVGMITLEDVLREIAE